MAEAASTAVTVNIFALIVGQIFAGQLIKKIIPLFLTMQLIFYSVLKLDFFPVNALTLVTMLDEAIKLEALKAYVFDYLEENQTIETIKETANETGMIVLIGIPFIITLTGIAILISYCCKKQPKCQELGKKLKDKLVFGMIVQIIMISFLAFA
jgi:hypothetical protein